MSQSEITKEAWQHDFGSRYLADVVLAANDGVVTTFAVVAGVVGATFDPAVIIILGCANLFADGASMGLGNYLGKRSEDAYQAEVRAQIKQAISTDPAGQRAVVRALYQTKGFDQVGCDTAVNVITADTDLWIETILRENKNIIPDGDGSPIKHGLVMFGAFVLVGSIPILPYIIPWLQPFGFGWSIFLSGLTLFVVGSLRSLITSARWYWAGLEMLFVGGIAAAIAYTVGVGLDRLIS